jgi:hypothetical protein
MAREYSQSGRESNGAKSRHQLAGQPRIPLGTRRTRRQGQASPLLYESLIGGFYGCNEAMAGFSELWKIFGFKPTRLSKTLGRGRFGMEPTANWEMSAKCVMRG